MKKVNSRYRNFSFVFENYIVWLKTIINYNNGLYECNNYDSVIVLRIPYVGTQGILSCSVIISSSVSRIGANRFVLSLHGTSKIK